MEERPQIPADEVYLTPDQIRDRYGGAITVRTVARWRFRNSKFRGPLFIKAGTRVLYPLSQLLQWEADNLRGLGLPPQSDGPKPGNPNKDNR